MKVFILFLLSLCIASCTNTSEEHSSVQKENLNKGKELFSKHCSQCHHKSMKIDMTAPALGKVMKIRDQEWIKQYILKGSEKSRVEGDTIALDLQKKGWALMPAFDFLSKEDVNNILLHINQVTQK